MHRGLLERDHMCKKVSTGPLPRNTYRKETLALSGSLEFETLVERIIKRIYKHEREVDPPVRSLTGSTTLGPESGCPLKSKLILITSSNFK